MKITKEQFKNIVREVMTEESEYQKFFAKALEKTGKSIPDMSDEEKKAFFNKIDSAWQGKGEKKNEGNAFGAAVTDAKEKGEDEFEVGGKEYKVEEALSVDPRKVYGGTGAKEGMVLVAQKGLEKILDLSKKNPSNVFLVSDDNYTKFGPYYVKNGKVAKYTVANPNYDLEKNKVSSLKVKSDVILKFKIVEGVESVNESFADPLEGFPQKYKDLLKKLQSSNNLSQMRTLKQKMNIIRKEMGLKPLTIESVNEASKPIIKVVTKLKNEQGIQIVVVKTTKGETEYGGFVVRGKLQKVIPVGANKTKEDVKKRALQIWDEFGKQLGETVSEGKLGDAWRKNNKKGYVLKVGNIELKSAGPSNSHDILVDRMPWGSFMMDYEAGGNDWWVKPTRGKDFWVDSIDDLIKRIKASK